MSATAMSYVSGPSQVPLIGETIGRYFDGVVAQHGDRIALVARQQGIRWSWNDLAAEVNAFAAGLVSLGLQPGERIGIWSPNNAEWVVTQFAAAKAGLILVNINPAYRLSELEYALNKVACREWPAHALPCQYPARPRASGARAVRRVAHAYRSNPGNEQAEM